MGTLFTTFCSALWNFFPRLWAHYGWTLIVVLIAAGLFGWWTSTVR